MINRRERTAVLSVKQTLPFTIVGRISPAHRATQFRDKAGVRRSFRNKDYDSTIRLIRLTAILAARNYIQPKPRTTTRVYIRFCIGTHTFVDRKDGTGYWKGRSVGDADNLKKPVLDALQGIFYKNDKWAVALPFSENMKNDNPFITRIDNRIGNRPDWTEVIVESTPAKQMTLETRQ